jgi:hypothetical protein
MNRNRHMLRSFEMGSPTVVRPRRSQQRPSARPDATRVLRPGAVGTSRRLHCATVEALDLETLRGGGRHEGGSTVLAVTRWLWVGLLVLTVVVLVVTMRNR